MTTHLDYSWPQPVPPPQPASERLGHLDAFELDQWPPQDTPLPTAVQQPRWSGRKTAVAAAMAIGSTPGATT